MSREATAYFNSPVDYVRHELDLWGYDLPLDWPCWRGQLAYHLPRFC